MPSLISPVPTTVITGITVIIIIIIIIISTPPPAAPARRRLPDPGRVEEGGLLLPRPRLRPCPLRLLELDELQGDENSNELGIGLGGV